ncbi:MAG: hybrid sensor histidine kinase/response regulator [Burkholderiaceae bacterium]|nr:hybrid sensor histidine kinase/response regulator [Burkholderiaceae bacterium]
MSEIEPMAANVLYVDDEELACKYFARAVAADYRVVTASGADGAIEILRQPDSAIDVVVTDFQMPGRNGGDLLRQIELEFPHVVRILVTAYADKKLLLQTVNSGEIFRILEKPLDLVDLRSALRKATDMARIRNDRMSRFMAIEETLGFLAHELNTPLAAISNFARGIQRRTAHGDASSSQQLEIEKVALAMQNNARYCLTVLSTFADSVRHAGAATLDHRETSARRLIDGLLDTYPLSAAQRAFIEVEVRQDFRIAALPNCVSLVLSSILSNALRALADRADPKLRFVVAVDENPCIQVIDNGPGIPTEIMEHLLEDPVTTHSDVGASGWGMIFCKRVMLSFGGGIRIESAMGISTCINLDFPIVRNQVKRSDR